MEKLKKLKTKYFSLSVAVRAAIWFTFCNLLQKGITMISMPIFTRLLTTEQYGEFTVYQSWYSIINVIVTFNLSGNLILNGMSKYENRRNEFISSIQTSFVQAPGMVSRFALQVANLERPCHKFGR